MFVVLQLPPELLKIEPLPKGRRTLIFDPSVRTMDPAAADVWAAAHVLLRLVGIRALQAFRPHTANCCSRAIGGTANELRAAQSRRPAAFLPAPTQ
jgi:hypothetical protein